MSIKWNPNFEDDINHLLQQKLTEVYEAGKGLPAVQVTTLLERAGITNAPELADSISRGIRPQVGA